ncbi:MAG TPA: hypothetical protein VJN19_09885 [Propionibacteriaceae bacterium]|nr:hypothetical protein [Propionibacteriaceae bacterium]
MSTVRTPRRFIGRSEQARRSHSSNDVVDDVIAATAQQYEADLWTRNIGHFPMFKSPAPY